MKIVYNGCTTLTSIPKSKELLLAETTQIYCVNAPDVDAVALVKCSFANCSIDYSTDGTNWINAANSIVAPAIGTIVTFTNVVGAKYWRLTNAGATGTYTLLYPGKLIEIRNPRYPFRYEEDIHAADRKTLGGVNYSKIRYTGKSGSFEFALAGTDNDLFRIAYNTSKGFRIPTIVEVPVTNEVAIVTGSGTYPLSLANSTYYTGTWPVEEVL